MKDHFTQLTTGNLTWMQLSHYTQSHYYRHALPSHVFVCLFSGKTHVEDATVRLHVNANEAYFIPKDKHVICDLLASTLEAYEGLVFFLDDALLARFLQHYKVSLPAVPYTPSSIFKLTPSFLLKQSITSFLPLFESEETIPKAHIEHKFFELLWLLYHQDKTGDFAAFLSHTTHQEALRLHTFLETHFRDYESVEAFAKGYKVSPSTFKRYCQKYLGTSCAKWVLARKLQEAAWHLSTTQENITTVSQNCGFHNLSYFIQQFKKTCHLTPKQYQLTQNQHK